ncbi:MAG TPA: cupin domain-containing protein [Polyangiaceae bacterium]|nr:cupin domain-containing protein [Polyangiaceae bacterium]
MSGQPLFLSPEAPRTDLHVVGEIIHVLADGSQTSGPEVFEQRGPEGSGPPPHTHPWDEAYFMLDGSMDVVLGDRTVVLTRGAFVYIPAGTVHCFRYRVGGGRFLSFNSRAGAAKFFRELDRVLPDGSVDLGKIVPIAVANQVVPAGPPPG